MPNHQKKVTRDQKVRILALDNENLVSRQIATRIGYSHSTIVQTKRRIVMCGSVKRHQVVLVSQLREQTTVHSKRVEMQYFNQVDLSANHMPTAKICGFIYKTAARLSWAKIGIKMIGNRLYGLTKANLIC